MSDAVGEVLLERALTSCVAGADTDNGKPRTRTIVYINGKGLNIAK